MPVKLRCSKSPQNLYSNWTLLAPDGQTLTRCSKKRALWYVRRSLAELVDPAAGVARLLFEPKSRPAQFDHYSLAPKANACVCCGGTDNLTKHHVIPSMFRKHFPFEAKTRQSHDVLLMCFACHERYETRADELKSRLIAQTGARFCGHPFETAKRFAKTLLAHRAQIPPGRQAEMISKISRLCGIPETPDAPSLALELAVPETELPGAHVVKQALAEQGLQNFVEMWRLHFLEHAAPAFLPDGWDPRRPAFFNSAPIRIPGRPA